MCEKITIFGFARQWYNATRYHYHNDYEPTGSQNARDSAEMIPLEKLVRDKPAKVMFGESEILNKSKVRFCNAIHLQ